MPRALGRGNLLAGVLDGMVSRQLLKVLIVCLLTLTTAGQLAAQHGKKPPADSAIGVTPDCVSGCLNYSVWVTPNGSTLTVAPNGNHTASFTVVNTGDYTDTYSFTCSRTLGVSCVSVYPTSATLSGGGDLAPQRCCGGGGGGGSSVTVTVTFHVGAAVDGNVYLTATGGATDQGWYTVKPTPVTPSGPLAERDLCLTIAAGPDAAYECGDLRIVHQLPAATTLNKPREPVLLYSTQQAYPFPSLNADLTLGVNDRPDSIVAIARLKVGGSFVERNRRAWAGTLWGPASQAATRRVMTNFSATDLSTGLYAFQLELNRYVSGVGYTTIRTDTGSIAIVNRIASPFGAGWWLAGFEQLQFQADGSILWIGGDGSARRYVKVNCCTGTTWYVARSADGPDSLSLTGTTYTRRLKGGVKVIFNSSGFHTQTINRLGYATVFAPDGSNRLASITLPPSGSGVVYTFSYGPGPNPLLSSVQQDSVGGAARITTITGLAITGGARVSSIVDPGVGASVVFAYGNGSYPGAITGRTDRRGNTTTYGLGTGLRLVSSSRPVPGAQTIGLSFCPAEIRVWVCGLGLAEPDSTYTIYDGPRIDSIDVSHFWMDSLGAVARIRDAYGQVTTISRADNRWPGLPTRVQTPAGLVTGATYDARGNLASVADTNPYGNGQNPKTTYLWDQSWDELTQITLPNGQQTQFGVDASNGNRLWVQDIRGTVSRTTFQYYTSGNGAKLLSTVIPPLGAQTTLTYDARGNAASAQTDSWTTYYIHDALGRLRTTRTPIAPAAYRNDTTAYDAADRVVRTATYGPVLSGEPAGLLTTNNFYDSESNLTKVQQSQSPNPTSINVLTTQWVYDAANRPVVTIATDGMRDSTWYDPASNPIVTRTRNGKVLEATFDRMNRPVRRVEPEMTYSALSSLGLLIQIDLPWDNYAGTHPYPWFPNNGTGLKIPSDTASLSYDIGGRLIKADNGDARVRRTYYANGQIQTDSLWIRNYASSTFGHSYGLLYNYDINGRLKALHHPGQLATGTGIRDSVFYVYSDTTGAINQVNTLLGQQISYSYDTRGDMLSQVFPGGIIDSLQYDALGRLISDRIKNNSSSPYKDPDSYLRYVSIGYSGPVRVSSATNTHGWKDVVGATYSGMGHLISLSYSRPGNVTDTALYVLGTGQTVGQSFHFDPLGNAYSHGASSAGGLGFGDRFSTNSTGTSVYKSVTARLDSTFDVGVKRSFVYDSAGNTILMYQSGTNGPLDDRASWYSAGGRLRFAEWRHADNYGSSPPWSDTFEEYRYDALGRRVLVISQRNCAYGTDSTLFANCQVGRVGRTVWDGSRELWEIQMPYGRWGSSSLENDTSPVAYYAGYDYQGLWADPSPLFGRVAYTHAGGVDQPVAITRFNLVRRKSGVDTKFWDPVELRPHWNWRGQADIGTFNDGGMKTCVDATHCVFAQWRGVAFANGLGSERLWTQPYGWTPFGWFGSLIQSKEDGTGTFYRRNRYVDPMTGRFTQEDPIGLAGGANVYGFGAGDPVTFADPFGLIAHGPCDVPDFSCLASMVSRRTRGLRHMEPAMLAVASLPAGGGFGVGMSEEVLALGATLRTSASGLLRAGGVAERVAAAVGGTVEALRSSEGFKVTVQGARDIVARIKANGDMRVSIAGVSSLTREGLVSSDPLLSHLENLSSQELVGLVQKAKSLLSVTR